MPKLLTEGIQVEFFCISCMQTYPSTETDPTKRVGKKYEAGK